MGSSCTNARGVDKATRIRGQEGQDSNATERKQPDGSKPQPANESQVNQQADTGEKKANPAPADQVQEVKRSKGPDAEPHTSDNMFQVNADTVEESKQKPQPKANKQPSLA